MFIEDLLGPGIFLLTLNILIHLILTTPSEVAASLNFTSQMRKAGLREGW